jgi:siroheme synthase (precorrin-2 oxidase/ferrochelatase)
MHVMSHPVWSASQAEMKGKITAACKLERYPLDTIQPPASCDFLTPAKRSSPGIYEAFPPALVEKCTVGERWRYNRPLERDGSDERAAKSI